MHRHPGPSVCIIFGGDLVDLTPAPRNLRRKLKGWKAAQKRLCSNAFQGKPQRLQQTHSPLRRVCLFSKLRVRRNAIQMEEAQTRGVLLFADVSLTL